MYSLYKSSQLGFLINEDDSLSSLHCHQCRENEEVIKINLPFSAYYSTFNEFLDSVLKG